MNLVYRGWITIWSELEKAPCPVVLTHKGKKLFKQNLFGKTKATFVLCFPVKKLHTFFSFFTSRINKQTNKKRFTQNKTEAGNKSSLFGLKVATLSVNRGHNQCFWGHLRLDRWLWDIQLSFVPFLLFFTSINLLNSSVNIIFLYFFPTQWQIHLRRQTARLQPPSAQILSPTS